MTKLATLTITLRANGQQLEMPRYEFNHALSCMGEKVSAWGSLPADRFRHRLTQARRHIKYTPQEFTACETTMRVGKEIVTFAPLDVEKVRAILTKLWVFAERAGDKEISF